MYKESIWVNTQEYDEQKILDSLVCDALKPVGPILDNSRKSPIYCYELTKTGLDMGGIDMTSLHKGSDNMPSRISWILSSRYPPSQ